MDLLIVLSWIGVFALSIGSFISLLSGGVVAGCLGILLTSLTASTLIPLKGKLRLMLGGSARIFLIQRMGGLLSGVGSWILVGIGGWEFVPAAVVMSVAAAWWPVMRVVERRRAAGGGRVGNFISDGMRDRDNAMITQADKPPTADKTAEDKPPANSSSLQSPPPQYTPVPVPTVASTVTIIIDDLAKTPAPPIKTPIFNV